MSAGQVQAPGSGRRAGHAVGEPTRILSGGSTSPRPVHRTAPTEPPAQRATWAQIDLDAIAANVAALKAHAAAPRLMAVVKADGYGHGLVPAARAALAGGADWLGVALVEEGAALRAAGITAPVLLMAEPPVEAVGALLDAGLTPAVYSPAFIDALAAARDPAAEPVAVHLKLDTGMRRVGVPEHDWEDALRRVRDTPGLRLEGLWSHLAVADEPGNPFTEVQVQRFRRGLRTAERMRVRPALVHLCNSAGTLALQEEHHDLVRAGIAVYGLRPSPAMTVPVPLRPALSWYSRLTLVKRLAPGEAVSYGLRWAPRRHTTVGTVPAGYADGVSRALTNRGRVLVRGRARPMIGTVCMDQFLVDLGDDAVESGDEVVLIGEQDGAQVTAEDWAGMLGTISYEIVCGVGRRVPRVYLGGEG